jgi:predicted ATPase/DNA-binding XRE family transcriptional regulator
VTVVRTVDAVTDETLGIALKKLRAAAGMTQEELAHRAGISARTISDVERGLRRVVHGDTARRLAAALGLSEWDRASFDALARGAVENTQPPGDLPVPPTRLLGRSGELASVIARLQDPQVRLLTLTGPGGIGKTRLALEVAARVRGLFGGGVFFVALGELRDAALVAPELAKAIGVVETGPELVELLPRRLAGKRALVVMDTFEHLMPAVPLIYSLLLSCPSATFLVTSRSALRLRGEHEFPVPPLGMPSTIRDTGPEDIDRWPATALFWERAQAVRPGLDLDPETASLIAEICRRLDALPLAIELAAARVRHLPLAAILSQLEHRLEFLVGGPLDLPLRQRAIRDTVGWSYDLLGPQEQTLLRRLSVFAGGWNLDAIANVAESADGAADPLHGISALVDQSLVVLQPHRSDPRYDMLDIVGEYAATRLSDAGETEEVERRHALHYLALAEAAEPHLVGSGHRDWFGRLDVDRGNLRRGMAWTIDRGETVLALRYTVALWRYWRQLGEFAEGTRWLIAALALTGNATPSLRAKALRGAFGLAFPQAVHTRMAELAAEATELAHLSDDPMDLRHAFAMHGMLAMCQGRYTDAIEPYTQSLAICRPLGLSWQLATSHLNLAHALLHSGRAEDAIPGFRQALQLYRELGDDIFAARVINHIAQAALAGSDLAHADRLARDALTSFAEHGERQGIAEGLDTLAAVAAARSEGERAATIAGAAAAIRETIASQAAPFDVAITGPVLQRIKAGVSEERWQRNWDRGRTLYPAAAVAYALANRAE